MKQEALEYLNTGLCVIPLKPRMKEPQVKWDRYQDQLPSIDQVSNWFDEWPDANLGIVTGTLSGIVVLDVDKGGSASIERFGPLPDTPTVKTRNGHHYYFKHTGQYVKTDDNILPGVDVRGDGGLIVAPPSVHPTGLRYEWIRPLGDIQLAAMPDWMREKVVVNFDRIEQEIAKQETIALDERTLYEIRREIKFISPEEYGNWIAVGMILHHEFGGNADGLAKWMAWASQSDKYNEDEHIYKWSTFGRKNGRKVTKGTLKEISRKGIYNEKT